MLFRKVYKIVITELNSNPATHFIYFALTRNSWRAIKEAEMFAAQKSVETKKQWALSDIQRIK